MDNYHSDYRVRAARRRQRIRVQGTQLIITLSDGDELHVPMKYSVCPTCEGRGNHVNPSIDAGGLSAADFAEDPDFAEDYCSGCYDVPCYECGGERVVPEVNRVLCTPEQLAAYDSWVKKHAAYDREVEAERRFGA